jgi:hypothetical protein
MIVLKKYYLKCLNFELINPALKDVPDKNPLLNFISAFTKENLKKSINNCKSLIS